MSGNDYLKYMTETFVRHFEQPKSERKQIRLERKEARPPTLFHWFGLIPASITMLFRKS
ncbi:YqzE family protein [Bacillus sp. FJAT-50079]|uniref:YqzE family protein n=1 Tax=Bacillus sp. FJAT-50079 TaxID=2833577 RepID=UPI001BCA477B|nr:YqzE family protein [Bacillus sp. FJAT-50079]MBS4209615.1 YqzE family protein [Bacillus sp. FJAT-50079]